MSPSEHAAPSSPLAVEEVEGRGGGGERRGGGGEGRGGEGRGWEGKGGMGRWNGYWQ